MTENAGALAPNPLESLPLTELHEAQMAALRSFVDAKNKVAWISAELSRRFAESAKNALTQAGKSHGTVTLPLQDGFTVKGDIKQTVKWDSAKLQAIAQTLPWERVSALFKIDFSMSETIYKGIAAVAPELRDKIDEARTTEVKAPALSLVKAEG